MSRATSNRTAGEQLALLPPPPFNPSWPKRGTLADKALALFMAGRYMDHPGFEETAQSWRLAAVVFELRTLGWPIESIDVPAPTEAAPQRVISVYHLPRRYLAYALAANKGHAHAAQP
jgi:hypothetical protein